MGFINWLIESIEEYGERINDYQDEKVEKENNYQPRFNGQWMNKGTKKDENWVWIKKETTIIPVYVNVFEMDENNYVIKMNNSAKPDAIDSTECESEWQAEHLMKNLGLYYKYIGNVKIVHELQQ